MATRNKAEPAVAPNRGKIVAAYCRAGVAQVCKEFGGDTEAIVLSGFSRGASAMDDSDMKPYLGGAKKENAELKRNIELNKKWAAEGK